MYVVDFETFPIEARPDYPPKPVGVAVQRVGSGPGMYHAWGHPTGNNTTKREAVRKLRAVFRSGEPLVFHNAPFDCAVAGSAGVKLPGWELLHDTVLLVFLANPREPNYKLKSLCERLLGRKPSERDAVQDWLVKHQPVPGVRVTVKNAKDYTAYAPGTLVAKYAVGDTSRTLQLFKRFHKGILEDGMGEAYDRERRLWAGLQRTEERGLRVNTRALRQDVASYTAALARLDRWIRKRLLASPELNIDSGAQLVDALLNAGVATEESLGVTPKGNVRTAREAIEGGVTDPKLVQCLGYRGQVGTCLKTFMRPWLHKSEEAAGLIYCRWRPYRSDGGGGARTGRLASSPNFQNLPKTFSGKLVAPPHKWLPPAPVVRSYVLPLERDHVLIGRDYSQQELRILAHFVAGDLLARYSKDPWLDFHDNARRMIAKATGVHWPRVPVKNLSFGLLYGMGLGLLAKQINGTVQEARGLKNAYLGSVGGVKDLFTEMRRRANADPEEPLWTWGGRRYFCEDPLWIGGHMQTFEYKMVNILIQGSAGDQMKEAMCRYYEAGYDEDAPLLISVHDELLCSTPRGLLHKSMNRLRVSMESLELDVPLLSEGGWSSRDWSALKAYDKKGVRVCRAK